MPDHGLIYQQEADRYQQLIAREDYMGNLLPLLNRVQPAAGLDVADLGAGTGRLACLLGPAAGSLLAFDSSPHMLSVAASKLAGLKLDHCAAVAADHRRIPLPAGSLDFVVSGWSLCYLVVWEPRGWRESLRAGLTEVERLLGEQGCLVILETLGTGVEQPQELEKLQAYFRYLEGDGFQRTWTRTDYQFQDQEEAASLVEFFFGPEMLPHIQPGEHPILPECTGIWWKRWGG